MTVYKPIRLLAEKAAEVAFNLASKKLITEKTVGINNGKRDVPSVLLEPVQVDKANLDATVIADGYHKKEDVYKK
jgi:D-xylose transport system substrate-binding protein